jgi:Transposase DDE domain
MIGQSLAQARGLVSKHAIKQVDRLLSNGGIDVWESFARWVAPVVGSREEILVAMDWTDFDGDDQATLALNLVTDHGRAMPLVWLSVWKHELKDQRNDFEDVCLLRLSQVVPPGCRVTSLADRGFGDHKLFAYLTDLGFGYVIRFRGNIHVTDASGETRTAAEWVGTSGQARKLRAARLPAAHAYQVGAVVCVHARDMKEPWCLAASDPEAPAAVLIKQYARRWTIKPSFRDTKDLRFGMGMSALRIAEPERRDRLLPLIQRVCEGAADHARGRRGEPGHGPAAQVQHIKDAHPLAVSPGMHALRADPQYARAAAAAADPALRGDARPQRAVAPVSARREMRR